MATPAPVFQQFTDIDAYYKEHPEARHSVESDYGCWWRDDDGGIWRVTYVHATGGDGVAIARRLFADEPFTETVEESE